MKLRLKGQVTSFDNLLLASTFLIVTLGLIVLYSLGIRAKQVSNQLDTSRQIVYAIIGLILMFIMARNDYKILNNYSSILYVIMVVLLLAVDFFGVTRLGATRWLSIGPFQFQPSEIAKLIMIIVLAKFYSRNYDYTVRAKYLLLSILYTLPPLLLVLVQPDLGTAIVIACIWLSMTVATRVKKRYIAGLIVLLLVSIPIIYPRLQPYQKQRISTFLNPVGDPQGTGYNVNQAIIAVGSGGFFGQGLGSGTQSQGNFLPSSPTDFVFAVLSEKLGFLGAIVVVVLFVTLISRIIIDAYHSQDRFGSFLCIGIATMFGVHFIVNIGMNVGIMPVTGIPLPLISAGGTSMMVGLFSLGIVQSVYMRRRGRELKDPELA